MTQPAPPKYLPFAAGSWRMALGLQPLAVQDWIEIDERFSEQLQLKADLFRNRQAEVFVSSPDSWAAQQEVLTLVVQHLLQYFPQHYGQQQASLQNRITGQVWNLQNLEQPLATASLLVQEDLCVLQNSSQHSSKNSLQVSPGQNPTPAPHSPAPHSPAPQPPEADHPSYHLTAASVCFPSRWDLRSKLGKPLTQIHQPVPRYDSTLAHPVDQVFARLRPDYPACRFNWSILETPDLFLPQALPYRGEPITARNAGELLWLRVERQTLRRLPQTQAILFTIRTYVNRLDQVLTSPQLAQQLAAALRSMPPTVQGYKSMGLFREGLLGYLESEDGEMGR